MASVYRSSREVVVINQNFSEAAEVMRISPEGKLLFISPEFAKYFETDFRNQISIPPNTIPGLQGKHSVGVPTMDSPLQDQQLFALAFTKVFFPTYLAPFRYSLQDRVQPL